MILKDLIQHLWSGYMSNNHLIMSGLATVYYNGNYLYQSNLFFRSEIMFYYLLMEMWIMMISMI